MARGGPGQVKGGASECKICAHPGRQEIDAMILNGTKYPAIIERMKQVHADVPALIPSNLTNHKKNHLLNNPITRVVQSEDGTQQIQTYLTGQYEAQNIVIPKEAVPQIPDLASALQIIIAAGLHNILNNPALVTPKDTLAAIQELKRLGGGSDEMEKFLGEWSAVADRKQQLTKQAKRKRTATVTVEDTVELPVEDAPIVKDLRVAGNVIDAEWSAADLENLALPAPGEEN